MSGPIVPPLTVSDEADGGSVSGRPITTIEVTSGTLTVSGRVATLDTSGSGGSPGTPAKSIQFNSDPAGTFTGSSQLLYETAANVGRIEMSSGAVATQPEIRTMTGRGLQISATDADESIRNQIVVFGENDAPDGIALYPATGLYVQVGDSTSTPAQITTRGATANMVLTTNLTEDKAKITLTAGADGDILVQTDNAGVLQLENTTTDADSVLSIMGNGTGDAKLDLQNASKRVWVLCDENKKLKIQGGAAGNTFVFDVTSATGGITWPDGTTQISASSGGGGTTYVSPTTANASYDRINIAAAPFYGGNGYIGNLPHSSSTVMDNPTFWNYLSPFTANMASIKYYVSSSGATNVVLGIYTDAGGYPGALIGKATADVSSTGYKDLTSYVESDGTTATTIPQTEGETYWVGYVRDTTAIAYTVYGVTANIGSTIMIQEPDDSNYDAYNLANSALALPATVTATDLSPRNSLPGGRIALAIK